MRQAEWQGSRLHELDLSSTELSTECLQDILCRNGAGFTYLGLGYCEFFNDQVFPTQHDEITSDELGVGPVALTTVES